MDNNKEYQQVFLLKGVIIASEVKGRVFFSMVMKTLLRVKAFLAAPTLKLDLVCVFVRNSHI